MLKLLADFLFFSIIGFIGEFVYCSLHGRSSGKALRGPWCPLYGIGGLFILKFIENLPKNIFIIYIVGVVLASITEYFTSLILEIIFKSRWWDYSNKKFNLNGRICLENSLLFGFLTLILFYIFLPLKTKFINLTPPLIYNLIISILSLIMFIDGLISFIEALSLKKSMEIIEEVGIENKNLIKRKLKNLSSFFSPKRLLEKFDFEEHEKTNFLKEHYKIKSVFIRRKDK